jgi:predicted heme/steroid binding protein
MAPRSKEMSVAQRSKMASAAGAEREFTWEELAEHNTAANAYIAHRGAVYDVAAWLRVHPGGRDTLVLNAGRDCTQILESYHEPELLKTMLGSAKVSVLSTRLHRVACAGSPCAHSCDAHQPRLRCTLAMHLRCSILLFSPPPLWFSFWFSFRSLALAC